MNLLLTDYVKKIDISNLSTFIFFSSIILTLNSCSQHQSNQSRNMAQEEVSEQLQDYDVEQFMTITKSLIDENNYFAKLRKIKIYWKEIHSNEYFFGTNVGRLSLVTNPPLDRNYIIEYSSNVLKNGPPLMAIKAILAHELIHLSDYTNMRLQKFAGNLLPMALNKEKLFRYERCTDARAIEIIGVGDGLIQYRKWQKTKLTSEQWKLKITRYLNFEEIVQVRDRILSPNIWCDSAFY